MARRKRSTGIGAAQRDALRDVWRGLRGLYREPYLLAALLALLNEWRMRPPGMKRALPQLSARSEAVHQAEIAHYAAWDADRAKREAFAALSPAEQARQQRTERIADLTRAINALDALTAPRRTELAELLAADAAEVG